MICLGVGEKGEMLISGFVDTILRRPVNLGLGFLQQAGQS
jgi:hypothetical protein